MTVLKFKNSKFLKVLAAIFLNLILLSGKGNISSAYWSLRYLQVPAIAWLIYVNGKTLSLQKDIKKYLSLSLMFVLFLEIWQFAIKQSTGWWWIFGERAFSLSTPNIAAIDIWGQEFLRPYATFSHPNALGGWLLLTGFVLWENNLQRWSAFGGTLLTFSRNAVLGLILGNVAFLSVPGKTILPSIVSFSEDSIPERTILNQTAVKIFSDFPVFGAGPGRMLSILPNYFPAGFWKIQPPHNAFLLILAETGLSGLAIIIIGALKIYPYLKNASGFFPGLIAVLSTAALDHYWITSQQNRIILGIFLGLCLLGGFRSNYQAAIPPLAFGKRRNVGPRRQLHMNNSSFGRS